jgi:hypothetical protein
MRAMPAKSPEEICRLFKLHMAEVDLKTILNLYDPQTVFLNHAREAKSGEGLKSRGGPLSVQENLVWLPHHAGRPVSRHRAPGQTRVETILWGSGVKAFTIGSLPPVRGDGCTAKRVAWGALITTSWRVGSITSKTGLWGETCSAPSEVHGPTKIGRAGEAMIRRSVPRYLC